MPVTSADCDLGYGTIRTPHKCILKVLLVTGGVVSGTVSEDNQFVFEGAWAGMVMDLGAGAYQISAEFNQDVTTAFPGSPTTVSGSFILNKQ